MPRAIRRLVFWLVGVPLMMGAAMVALLSTPWGTRFVVGKAVPIINSRINGRLEIGEARGSLFGRLDFRDVTLRDLSGTPLLTAGRMVIGYRVIDLLNNQINVDPVILEHPTVQLVQSRPGEPYPLLRVFQKNPVPGTSRSEVVLRNVTITDGRVTATIPAAPRALGDESPAQEPLLRTIEMEALDLDLPLLRVVSGAGEPLDADVEVEAATATVTEPKAGLRALEGRATIRGDSIAFDLAQLELPATSLQGEGWIVLDSASRPAFEGTLDIDRLATSDIAGISPQVPRGWTISGDAKATAAGTGAMSVELTGFEAFRSAGGGSVRGRLAMDVSPNGRWRQRDTRIELRDFDLAPVWSMLKEPPPVRVDGRLRGRVLVNGPQDSLKLDVDVVLRQSIPDTTLESRVRGKGEIALPLGGTVAVRDFAIDTALLEMRALRAMNPDMPLVGRVEMAGRARGSMDDMSFNGRARYREDTLPPSDVRAVVRLARHSPYHLEADLDLDSLRLSGLQRSFPSLAKGGAMGGRLHLAGPLDTLAVTGRVGGTPGRVQVAAIVTAAKGSIEVRDADLVADSVNLAAINAALPKSAIFGHVAGGARLRGDTIESATFRATIDTSRVGESTVETASVSARTAEGLILFDSLLVRGSGLEIDGGGSIGLPGRRGTMTLHVAADSIAKLEPWFALLPDSMQRLAPYAGSLELGATVSGSIADYALEARANAERVASRLGSLKAGTLTGRWASRAREFTVEAGFDSLSNRRLTAQRLDAAASGTVEAFTWRGTASFSHNGKVAGSGKASADAAANRVFELDSLSLSRDSATWRLQQPARVELRDEHWTFSNTELVRAGPGDPARLAITGSLAARDSTGRVSAVIENFPLADLALYPATGRGQPLTGTLDGRFDLAGSLRSPTGEGQLTVLNAKYDTLPLPELRVRASYLEGMLDANAAVIMGSRPSVLEARIPLRKGTSENTSRLDFTADSLPIAWLDPLLPTVQELAGVVNGKVRMTGSFESPDLSGGLTFDGGEATLLGLGLHYTRASGKLSFAGETMRVERFAVSSQEKLGEDSLVVTGAVKLTALNDPELDLDIKARDFHLMNDDNLFNGRATADVRLTGPFFAATLSGRARVTTGIVYVDRFVQKRVVDLSDSLFAQFVDTTVLREEKLGADPVTLFMAGLFIDGFDADLGNEFWMRSADANIQLSGQLQLSKIGRQYSVDGTVQTLRGIYTLRLAPGTAREFEVAQGSIRYFGTPDLNGALDINATHELQTASGDPMVVTVHIGGTILAPSVDLRADAQPPLGESEVISYLIFGAPSFQAFMNDRSGQQRSIFEQSVEGFTGVLSGQLESSIGAFLPLDYFKIQPGEVQSGLSGTELVLGKQINLFGRPSWLKASPRLCPSGTLLSMDQIGLSLETRLTRQWGLAASIDPLRGCETALPPASSHYGLGFDVFWERRGLGRGRGRRDRGRH